MVGRRVELAAAAGARLAPAACCLTRSLSVVECLAGEDEVALFQDVVGVELGHRGDHDSFDVAGARMKDRIVGGQAEQDRAPLEGALAGLRSWSRRRTRRPRPRSGRGA